ncbi:murein hydrolase activator EnvC family protein [Candidatus Margulisiibacteriota bacterium]
MGDKNSRLKLVALIILASLFWSMVIPGLADDVEEKRQKLWDITKQLKIKRQQLETIKKKQNQTLRNLVIINKNLKRTQHELNYAASQLTYKERQIQETKQNIATMKESYIIQKNLFRKRIRDIYKENRLGYLVLLFSAKTLGDFLNSTLYFEKILKADTELLGTLIQQQERIEQKERQLKRRHSEIGDIKKLFEERKTYFRRKQIDQNKVYSEVAKKRKEYERQIAELERNSQEIENLIVRLLAQGKTSSVKGSGRFAWPLRGKLTSYYGYRRHPIFRSVRFHAGIDIGARTGARIRAADAGQVIFVGWWGGYGRATIIDHGNGYSTVYAHQSKIFVKKHQYVKKGQVIGAVGSTGYATGPHLHFEIRKRGKTANPLRFL